MFLIVLNRLRWPNTVFACAFADAIQRAHKDCKKQTCGQLSDHFINSTPAVSVLFFSTIERNVLMALVFCQRYVRKGNDAKNPGILSFFFVTERTQLNQAHA